MQYWVNVVNVLSRTWEEKKFLYFSRGVADNQVNHVNPPVADNQVNHVNPPVAECVIRSR
jgi:hypothetical protein